MTFDPTIPSAGNLISAQYSLIQGNFYLSNGYYGLDHFPWNPATANSGYHQKVFFPTTWASSTSPTIVSPGGLIYTYPVSGSTITTAELFYRNASANIQITNSQGGGGVAGLGVAKAWVSFNGNTPSTIFDSYNVSSITRSGAVPNTSFLVIFSSALIYTPYCIQVSTGIGGTIMYPLYSTRTSFVIYTGQSTTPAGNWPTINATVYSK